MEKLNKLKEVIQNESVVHNENLFSEIEKIQTQFKKAHITFLIVGSSCAGKTTLTNQLCLSILDVDKWKGSSLLPTSSVDNTRYFTVIKASQNGKYNWKYEVEGKKITEKVGQGLNELSNDMKIFLESHMKRDKGLFGDPSTKFKNSKAILTIEVPQLKENVQIVDTPSLSTASNVDLIVDQVKHNTIPVIILVKDICDKESINEKTVNFFKTLQKQFSRIYAFIAFTKFDNLQKSLSNVGNEVEYSENEINDTVSSYSNNIKYFFESLRAFDNLEVIDVFLLNSLGALRDQELDKRNSIRFTETLLSFSNSNKNDLSERYMLDNVRNYLDEQKNICIKESNFNPDNLKMLINGLNSDKTRFKEKVDQLFDELSNNNNLIQQLKSISQNNTNKNELNKDFLDVLSQEIKETKRRCLRFSYDYLDEKTKTLIESDSKISHNILLPQLNKSQSNKEKKTYLNFPMFLVSCLIGGTITLLGNYLYQGKSYTYNENQYFSKTTFNIFSFILTTGLIYSLKMFCKKSHSNDDSFIKNFLHVVAQNKSKLTEEIYREFEDNLNTFETKINNLPAYVSFYTKLSNELIPINTKPKLQFNHAKELSEKVVKISEAAPHLSSEIKEFMRRTLI